MANAKVECRLADRVQMIDPSELLRPEARFAAKDISMFRDYSVDHTNPLKERVRITYEKMHRNQTVAFVKDRQEKWLKFNAFKATMRQALEKLNSLVDESDPDVDVPNIVHAFQTAERIRRDWPNERWFQLTGLIHDAGKVMALHGEPQWAVVGDTYVVGCKWADSIVYRSTSFAGNPDGLDPRYNTKYGMYSADCGLDNLLMSWSHDEYLYQVLRHNGTSLPSEAMYMIRYHSFYPWHAGGDYAHLANTDDERMKPWVLEFNKYDLYTKSEDIPDIEQLWPYYQGLIDEFIPGALNW